MKEKPTARLPNRAASTRRISASAPARRSLSEGGFFNKHAAPFGLFSLRACIPALICALSASVYANLITVTNTNDNGSGSLRQALADPNDGDTIEFAVTGTIVESTLSHDRGTYGGAIYNDTGPVSIGNTILCPLLGPLQDDGGPTFTRLTTR